VHKTVENSKMARAAQTQPAARAAETIDNDTGEVVEGREVATQATFGSGQASLNETDFEVVQYVSVPMLSAKEAPPGRPWVCQIADAMHEAPMIEGVKPKYENSPLIICTIKALNGEARVLPCSKVFRQEIDAKYPNNSYVGKWFQVTRLPKKEGKNYWTFAIAEVRLKANAAARLAA
jgi:hypothetical protein